LTNDDEERRGELIKYLEEKGNQHVVMERILPTIEDCFINLLRN